MKLEQTENQMRYDIHPLEHEPSRGKDSRKLSPAKKKEKTVNLNPEPVNTMPTEAERFLSRIKNKNYDSLGLDQLIQARYSITKGLSRKNFLSEDGKKDLSIWLDMVNQHIEEKIKDNQVDEPKIAADKKMPDNLQTVLEEDITPLEVINVTQDLDQNYIERRKHEFHELNKKTITQLVPGIELKYKDIEYKIIAIPDKRHGEYILSPIIRNSLNEVIELTQEELLAAMNNRDVTAIYWPQKEGTAKAPEPLVSEEVKNSLSFPQIKSQHETFRVELEKTTIGEENPGEKTVVLNLNTLELLLSEKQQELEKTAKRKWWNPKRRKLEQDIKGLKNTIAEAKMAVEKEEKEKREASLMQGVETFEELYAALDKIKEIKGSKEIHTAEKITKDINDFIDLLHEAYKKDGIILNPKHFLNSITNTYKLRNRIFYLIEKEILALQIKQPPITEIVDSGSLTVRPKNARKYPAEIEGITLNEEETKEEKIERLKRFIEEKKSLLETLRKK